MRGQRVRADVRHEPVLRRRVLRVRTARAAPERPAAGAARRPHDLHLPAGYQVHLPQVRPQQHHPEPRRVVRAAAERGQRENVHPHLVLVRGAGSATVRPGRLPRLSHWLPVATTATAAYLAQNHVAPRRPSRRPAPRRG